MRNNKFNNKATELNGYLKWFCFVTDIYFRRSQKNNSFKKRQ